MNKRFSYDNMIKSRSIEPSDIFTTFKLDRCCDFMEEKYNNPKLTQKQICTQLGFTDRTIRRYRDDIKMDSPYRINNNKKKTPKQKPSIITEDHSKNEIIKTTTSKRSKSNVIKGGNISNIHTISGKELIDQSFESDKANSILENKQEGKTKLITIARRLVDSSYKQYNCMNIINNHYF